MSNFKPLVSSGIERFRSYLGELAEKLTDPNHIANLEVFAYDMTDLEFEAEILLKDAFPDIDIEIAKIERASAKEMVKDINCCLKTPYYTAEMVIYLREGSVNPFPKSETQIDYSQDYLRRLKEVINYEESAIHCCDGEEPYFYVHWQFTYIINSEVENRCLIIHGGSSD